jgi:hypothetical protein
MPLHWPKPASKRATSSPGPADFESPAADSAVQAHIRRTSTLHGMLLSETPHIRNISTDTGPRRTTTFREMLGNVSGPSRWSCSNINAKLDGQELRGTDGVNHGRQVLNQLSKIELALPGQHAGVLAAIGAAFSQPRIHLHHECFGFIKRNEVENNFRKNLADWGHADENIAFRAACEMAKHPAVAQALGAVFEPVSKQAADSTPLNLIKQKLHNMQSVQPQNFLMSLRDETVTVPSADALLLEATSAVENKLLTQQIQITQALRSLKPLEIVENTPETTSSEEIQPR